MNTKILFAILGAALCVSPFISTQAQESAPVQATVTLPIWPKDKMPGKGSEGTEHATPARGDGVIRLTDINEPTIAVFKAPGASKATPAVIICPGGGYGILAYNKEGTDIAAWLNSIGITGVVLKYRVPKTQIKST